MLLPWRVGSALSMWLSSGRHCHAGIFKENCALFMVWHKDTAFSSGKIPDQH